MLYPEPIYRGVPSVGLRSNNLWGIILLLPKSRQIGTVSLDGSIFALQQLAQPGCLPKSAVGICYCSGIVSLHSCFLDCMLSARILQVLDLA